MVGIISTGNFSEVVFRDDGEAVAIEIFFNFSIHSFSPEDSSPFFPHVCCRTNSDIAIEVPSKCRKHNKQMFRYLTVSVGLDEFSASRFSCNSCAMEISAVW